MINTAEIESGDKVHLRDGSVVVAQNHDGSIRLITDAIDWYWSKDGQRLVRQRGQCHPLDIIRIEKARKPVVETYWLLKVDDEDALFSLVDPQCYWKRIHKIIITDGEATIERVK